MTGPEHYRHAEELVTEAHRLLGQGDGQATAGVWAIPWRVIAAQLGSRDCRGLR